MLSGHILLVEDDLAHHVHAAGGHLCQVLSVEAVLLLVLVLVLLLELNCLSTCWKPSFLYLTSRGPLCENSLTQQHTIEAHRALRVVHIYSCSPKRP